MRKKLMLAMSGGVDSSAALVLLKEHFDVIGGTMSLFDKDELCGKCSAKDVEDAKNVAAKLGIEHHVIGLKEQFREHVTDDFVQTYLDGGTPNPCVQCNKHIKFGALLDEAIKLGCEYFATGHYARVEYDESRGRYLLKKATVDDKINPKDQSYVLYNLTQEQLKRIVFPLGTMNKEQVREIALQNGLVNADKPDSQDICFVPDGDYAGFIDRYGAEYTHGSFVDIHGNILGEHKGIIHYTIGQRKGLGLSFGKPMFVVAKNAENNTVTLGEQELLFTSEITARDVNLIATDKLTSPQHCTAKTRYTGAEIPCEISDLGNGRVQVIFDKPQRAAARGQSVVFYDGDIVIGGGIIE